MVINEDRKVPSILWLTDGKRDIATVNMLTACDTLMLFVGLRFVIICTRFEVTDQASVSQS